MSDKVYIFTASFCQPCKRLKESLEGQDEYIKTRNIKFFDIEESFELALKYNIRTAPTVLVLDEQDEVRTMSVGVSDLMQLKKVLCDV